MPFPQADLLTGEALFDRIVAASGLTPTIAPFTIRRLLAHENIEPPESVSRAQLERILPRLSDALRVYLGRAEHERALGDLKALL